MMIRKISTLMTAERAEDGVGRLIPPRAINLAIFALGTIYALLFQRYRSCDIDNPWFLSFSYNFWDEKIYTDYFSGYVFPNGMGGTIAFGKIATALVMLYVAPQYTYLAYLNRDGGYAKAIYMWFRKKYQTHKLRGICRNKIFTSMAIIVYGFPIQITTDGPPLILSSM